MTETRGEQKQSVYPAVVAFVLEDVGIDGRRSIVEALRGLSDEGKLDFRNELLRGVNNSGAPRACLSVLLGPAKDAMPTLLGEAERAVMSRLAESPGVWASMLTDVLKNCRERGSRLLCLTSLPEVEAKSLLEKLGWGGLEIKIHVVSEVKEDFPPSSAWVRAVRALGERPFSSLAIVSSKVCGLSALKAGLKYIVLADERTAHEEFPGASWVAEDVGSVSARDVMEALGLRK